MPPTTLGVLMVVQSLRPGSTRSGEKARKKSCPHFQPAGFFQARQHQLARGAGVGARFEHDDHAGVHVLGQGFGGADDEGQVGVAGLAQGGRDTDGDGIDFFQGGKIAGGLQAALADQALDGGIGYVQHVAIAALDAGHFFGDRVDADDFEAGLGKHHGKWQSHVAQTQNADRGAVIFQTLDQCSKNRIIHEKFISNAFGIRLMDYYFQNRKGKLSLQMIIIPFNGIIISLNMKLHFSDLQAHYSQQKKWQSRNICSFTFLSLMREKIDRKATATAFMISRARR